MASRQKASAILEPLEPNLTDQITQLAYQLWQARGCPDGSPDQDWFEAERTVGSHESS